jgi:hypothetical protein
VGGLRSTYVGRPHKDGPVLRQRGHVWYATVYVGDEAKAAAVARSWAEQAQAPGRPASQTTLYDALSDLIEDGKDSYGSLLFGDLGIVTLSLGLPFWFPGIFSASFKNVE